MRYRYLLLSLMTGSLFLAAASCGGDSKSSSGGTSNTGGADNEGTGGTSTGTGGTSTGTGGNGTGGSSSNPGGTTYIEAETAGLSIGRGAYDYVDMGGSSIQLTNPESGKLCGKGTAAQVVNMMYSTIWGGGIGISLAEDGSSFDASAYDGFEFQISGVPSGALRVGVTIASDPNNAFFTTDVSDGANSLYWEDLAQGDWVANPSTLDTSTLKDIQFQVASNDKEAVTFDFCVWDIHFIRGSDGMAGHGGTSGD